MGDRLQQLKGFTSSNKAAKRKAASNDSPYSVLAVLRMLHSLRAHNVLFPRLKTLLLSLRKMHFHTSLTFESVVFKDFTIPSIRLTT